MLILSKKTVFHHLAFNVTYSLVQSMTTIQTDHQNQTRSDGGGLNYNQGRFQSHNSFVYFKGKPALNLHKFCRKEYVDVCMDICIPTRNRAKDVMKPSLVSSHVPPYSSSSICWKLLKYTYKTPALMMQNLVKQTHGDVEFSVYSLQLLTMIL